MTLEIFAVFMTCVSIAMIFMIMTLDDSILDEHENNIFGTLLIALVMIIIGVTMIELSNFLVVISIAAILVTILKVKKY